MAVMAVVDMQASLLQAVRSIVPPLSHASHKGQAGRIGVIGGSLEYTGAPYFAAITAMRAGADLSHVFCPEEAAPVIKSYSPELIVHPLLNASGDMSSVLEGVSQWLPRLNALVVGPGLGREASQMTNVKHLLQRARERQMDMVIDADGLYLVTQSPECVTDYSRVILSPNAIEFQRLYHKMFGHNPEPSGDMQEQTRALAETLGNLTILRKGATDIISNGQQVIECTEVGCPRRCGGQGDLLSGLTALLYFWARQAQDRLSSDTSLPPSMVACFGASFLIKKCAEQAFNKHHRSMLAGDMVTEIPTAFQKYLELTEQ
ncbi:ATP-dependent (S)-NAD(P)H-hydrate dehydratase-like [Halichondria panicea]|uniref:ATP-dependent (S)-NAD(P)H-hydrate dehydratase-like n=1 Tax=Halichondria panicea TaxID=6063 RepID=UPI00312B3F91